MRTCLLRSDDDPTDPDLEVIDPEVIDPGPGTAIASVVDDLSPLVTRQPVRPDQHPALVYLARLSSGSQRTMRAALDKIAELATGGRANRFGCPWKAMRYQHTNALRSRLAGIYSPANANKHVSALKGVLKECWRLGQMDAESYHRAVDLERIKGSTLPRGRALDQGELLALFRACADDQSPAGARDAALLAVLYGAGLRRSESVSLDLDHYDANSGALTVKNGKGAKDRMVYLTAGGRDALKAWISIRGDRDGALFWPINKGGRLNPRRMSDQAVLRMVRKRGRLAGVARFSPHDCRRSFVGDLLDAGADISTVQQLAGHADPKTTAKYDRRGEKTKRKASELLHIPYVSGAPARHQSDDVSSAVSSE